MHNALAAVRPGGRVLYATCSTEPEENEEVVDVVLQKCPQAEQIGEPVDTFHIAHPGEGFFAVLLRKN